MEAPPQSYWDPRRVRKHSHLRGASKRPRHALGLRSPSEIIQTAGSEPLAPGGTEFRLAVVNGLRPSALPPSRGGGTSHKYSCVAWRPRPSQSVSAIGGVDESFRLIVSVVVDVVQARLLKKPQPSVLHSMQ